MRTSNPKKALSVAKTALRVARRVQKQQEIHHIYDYETNVTPGTTPAVYAMNDCKQGTDEGNRLGDDINMKSMVIQYDVAIDNLMTTTDNVRLVVVKDKQNVGVEPAFASVFLANGVSTLKDERSPYARRYKVLKDMRLSLDAGGKRSAIGTIRIPLNFKATYNGNAGDYTDLRENGLFLMLVGAQNTYKSAWNVYWHITFTDS